MIIDNNNTFVVATPTKCGSESLEKDVIKIHKVGRRVIGYGKHQIVDLKGDFKKYLLVRNPLERFASIYYFIGNSKGNVNDVSGLFNAAREDDVNLFCRRYIDSRKTVWSIQLSEYLFTFRPDNIYRLEDGLHNILKEFGVDVEPSKINTNRNNLGFIKLANRMSTVLEKEIREVHKESMKLLGYL